MKISSKALDIVPTFRGVIKSNFWFARGVNAFVLLVLEWLNVGGRFEEGSDSFVA